MATQLEDDFEEDAPDLVLDDEDDGGDAHEPEPDNDDDAEAEPPAADDADEDEITFGGSAIRDEDEPEGLRNLRTAYNEEKRKRRELEAKLAPPVEDIGPEPGMDDDDVQWDEAAFKRKWSEWTRRKAEADERGRAEREAAEAALREWQADLSTYEQQKTGLKVRDFAAAEDEVKSRLSDAQQSLLIQASNNKAALTYALAKNPEKLGELAKITNPVKFTAAVARLDMETKVSKRKPATQPETAHRGSGSFSGGNAQREKLERDAAKSGDYSKLVAYMAKAEKR